MKHVAIRLEDPKYKRLKITVARQGITIQQAVETAIDRYLTEAASRSRPDENALKDFRGFLRDTDVMDLMEQDRLEELARDRGRL